MVSTAQAGGDDSIQRGLRVFDAPPNSSLDESSLLAELAGPKRLVITGGTGNQGTWESRELENGVFTYYFLQALQDVLNDANQNGRISADEAYWYSKDLVEQWVADRSLARHSNRPSSTTAMARWN